MTDSIMQLNKIPYPPSFEKIRREQYDSVVNNKYDHWCDTGPKHTDTYYWELKALQEKCESFVNSVYDEYSLQTILDYIQKALYDAEIGNLKP